VSLRERLEAKQRRRLTVPVLVSDPSADQHVLNGAAVALQVAQARDEPEEGEIETLRKAQEDAIAAVQANFVEVEVQAMSSTDWEAAMAAWSGDEVDWSAALAPLLAQSCVDEELRDEQWWGDCLAGPAWSEGDLDALKMALLRLNVTAASPTVPKG
jgi:hypothetical protein